MIRAIALLLFIPLAGCATLDRLNQAPHPWDMRPDQRGAIGFALGLGGSLAALNIVDHNDKTAHAWAGFAVASSVGMVLPPVYGLTVGVGLGVAKEASDSRTHDPDGVDALATIGGAIIGWCLTSMCWKAVAEELP